MAHTVDAHVPTHQIRNKVGKLHAGREFTVNEHRLRDYAASPRPARLGLPEVPMHLINQDVTTGTLKLVAMQNEYRFVVETCELQRE